MCQQATLAVPQIAPQFGPCDTGGEAIHSIKGGISAQLEIQFEILP
jgi:hypothetical protein